MNQLPDQPTPITHLCVVVNPERDHAAVAKEALPAGTRLLGLRDEEITLRAAIPAGHRFAIRPVEAGEWVLQYGQPFAIARQALQPGDPVNDETVESDVPQVDPDNIQVQPPLLPLWEGALPVFQGFHRPISPFRPIARSRLASMRTSMVNPGPLCSLTRRSRLILTRWQGPSRSGSSTLILPLPRRARPRSYAFC